MAVNNISVFLIKAYGKDSYLSKFDGLWVRELDKCMKSDSADPHLCKICQVLKTIGKTVEANQKWVGVLYKGKHEEIKLSEDISPDR